MNPTDRDAGAPPQRPSVASTHPRAHPLPESVPKPASDDPHAPQRVAAILASASYRPADRDTEFLEWDAVRGVRLAIDYQKAELLLERHRIAHTIVVFGSTRLREPAAARRQREEAEAAAAAAPGDRQLAWRAGVARRLEAKSHYYEVAREFGRLVARAQVGPGAGRAVVMTGGGPGIMEAANRGADETGAPTVGLNITLPHEQFPNPYVTPELCFSFHYFAIRKLHFLNRARALVAFPGGFGTLDELFETLTLIQTRKMPAVPVVLVGREYWERAFDVEFLVAEGTVDPEDRDLFGFAETAEEAWHMICRWHAAACTSHFQVHEG
ncbi:MAG: TIGR00730 family Rossman fold protein [Proteobacteria bacterium]|nr:TIGR00730 family Rossman fold protein [Pseudomonadota bacterium]